MEEGGGKRGLKGGSKERGRAKEEDGGLKERMEESSPER